MLYVSVDQRNQEVIQALVTILICLVPTHWWKKELWVDVLFPENFVRNRLQRNTSSNFPMLQSCKPKDATVSILIENQILQFSYKIPLNQRRSNLTDICFPIYCSVCRYELISKLILEIMTKWWLESIILIILPLARFSIQQMWAKVVTSVDLKLYRWCVGCVHSQRLCRDVSVHGCIKQHGWRWPWSHARRLHQSASQTGKLLLCSDSFLLSRCSMKGLSRLCFQSSTLQKLLQQTQLGRFLLAFQNTWRGRYLSTSPKLTQSPCWRRTTASLSLTVKKKKDEDVPHL